MKKIIFILIILILVGGCNNSNGVSKSLAKCIGGKSSIYISNGCIACAKQEELFGESFKELNVIDCTEEPEKCRDVGIIAVPTWIINGKEYRGVQSIEKLQELTNCG